MTPATLTRPRAPLTSAALPPEQRRLLLHDFGTCRDGYTSEDCDRVLSRWGFALGLDLRCVWDNEDGDGFHGNSEWVVMDLDRAGRRRYREIPEGLWAFLAGEDPTTGERPTIRPDDATLTTWLEDIRQNAATPGRRVKIGSPAHESGVSLAYRAR